MTMQEKIERTKAEYVQARQQLERVFAATPDDKVGWSPSPSARTPIHLVVHSANAVQNLHNMMQGQPFAPPTPADADPMFRAFESRFTTREEALAFLAEVSDSFVAWLDALTPEQYEFLAIMPFGMPRMPVGEAMIFPALHMRTHISQIEYIQTIYGDQVWH